MTRQELEGKTVTELRNMCKERGITYSVHSRKLTKTEVIDKLLCFEDDKVDVQKKNEEAGEAEVVANAEAKSKYIETIQPGILVAFREPGTNRLNTAKVIKKSTKSRKLMLQTQYGAEYIVAFESVVWVKTGSRWPKGIYNELKGAR